MGSLGDFKDYLVGRRDVLRRAEKRLCTIQEKYEEFYAEVTRIREAEYQQLRDHIVADRDAVPKELNRQLDEARRRAERALADKLKELEKKRDGLLSLAEKKRQNSLAGEQNLHRKNVRLDGEEEALKARNEKLLAAITSFNQRIREMGRGLGFFWNLFAMHSLRSERLRLETEQQDVAARIDELRRRWTEIDAEQANNEATLQAAWLELRDQTAVLETKLEHLRTTRERIIERTAIEEVLFARQPKLDPPKPRDPRCPRCNRPNPASSHFCQICAQRLKPDEPGMEGSLLEIAELNRHHQNFAEGMKACQEIIGLVRGLESGLGNFMKSVEDMLNTERVYPVGTLSIDVPKASIAYGESFEKLAEGSDPKRSLHPKDFAAHIHKRVADVYTEAKIKVFFETMGEELSRQADSQW